MIQAKIYTTSYCRYCKMAKSLMESKGLSFTEINLDNDPEERLRLQAQTGFRTVPQIFINDEFIGGYSELKALNDSGGLDKKINSK